MFNLGCKFCGKQSLNVDSVEFANQEEATHYATLNCECYQAKDYATRDTSIQRLDSFIDDIENNFSEDDIALDDETKKLLKLAGRHVMDYGCSISYKIGTVKIDFSINSKDKLIIGTTRTESNKLQI